MEMALKQHSAETSSAQTSQCLNVQAPKRWHQNGWAQTVEPKCHVPPTATERLKKC